MTAEDDEGLAVGSARRGATGATPGNRLPLLSPSTWSPSGRARCSGCDRLATGMTADPGLGLAVGTTP
jgi:hypothetical protein